MNLFDLPKHLPSKEEAEIFETIHTAEHVRIERIISTGQVSAPDEWMQQEESEWVVLLAGEAHIAFAEGETIVLKKGDSLFIESQKKHRLLFTSAKPVCIWLAVHMG